MCNYLGINIYLEQDALCTGTVKALLSINLKKGRYLIVTPFIYFVYY
jgi:hypothetical protein